MPGIAARIDKPGPTMLMASETTRPTIVEAFGAEKPTNRPGPTVTRIDRKGLPPKSTGQLACAGVVGDRDTHLTVATADRANGRIQ